MTKIVARKHLSIGYILLVMGLITGLLINKSSGTNNVINPILFGYMFWSVYWGYRIAYNRISMQFSNFLNAPVHIKAKGTGDFLSKSIAYKFTIEFIKFWICYFIGAFGGAIILQIRLSKIAYFE